jgi:hypothetical protein
LLTGDGPAALSVETQLHMHACLSGMEVFTLVKSVAKEAE